VRARLGDRARDRVEDRDALEVGAAPARGHTRDHLRAVLAAEARVQLAGGAGDALGEDARPAVDEHAHRYPSLTLIGIRSSVSFAHAHRYPSLTLMDASARPRLPSARRRACRWR